MSLWFIMRSTTNQCIYRYVNLMYYKERNFSFASYSYFNRYISNNVIRWLCSTILFLHVSLSQYSDTTTRWMMWGFHFQLGQECALLQKKQDWLHSPLSPPIPWVLGILSPEIKWLGHEANLTPLPVSLRLCSTTCLHCMLWHLIITDACVWPQLSMWDMWWRQWHSKRFSSQHFGFILSIIIPWMPTCSTFIHSSIHHLQLVWRLLAAAVLCHLTPSVP
jgi:hypothetical protein